MSVEEKLKKYNQTHLLKFEEELTEQERLELYNQIEELDFSYLNELNTNFVEKVFFSFKKQRNRHTFACRRNGNTPWIKQTKRQF